MFFVPHDLRSFVHLDLRLFKKLNSDLDLPLRKTHFIPPFIIPTSFSTSLHHLSLPYLFIPLLKLILSVNDNALYDEYIRLFDIHRRLT